ncbi:LodA/GoxA family CTQ-dependent oxidase [Streptomyces sp. NBC_00893]|uniref:LodA/GoxA family CTQ-dependent oxidase n=1 Tax=Streptomyces sp. NBC_00893 TaxID=2975862 RepID=UPI0022529492|nr:LodA/GoxA family CTQ-dependent oxidase [Streptomyces sp. NBC_00893]MCX4851274.1 LodA/GoxA family CTQ-dependent oxidase [Streptomyces sp. NBC_00893]
MIGTPEPFEDTAGLPRLPGCAEDAAAALKLMFVDLTQRARMARGQDPVKRPVFLKPHGVARGTFTVADDLPAELRVGFLEAARTRPGGLTAWVRFSSDTVPGSSDLKTTLGAGIKLFGVPGPKLLEADTEADTQDLLLQNHDVFFVDTAQDMCEFTKAGVIDGSYDPYLEAHPVTKEVLDAMAKFEQSVLTTSFWGVLPYAFGPDRFVKYKLVPAGCEPGDPKATPPDEDPTYLGADLAYRLAAGPAVFDLLLQFRTDDDRMPLDRATVRWEESESSPVKVAQLTFQQQDVTARGQAAYGENLALNPWHSLADHRPVGSIAEVRRTVYQASAEQRRDVNGVPAAEPGPARPYLTPPPPRDTRIVRAAVHPAIGVARVGDSRMDDFVLASEVDDPAPLPAGSYKDVTGALKRQGVRFRVYGYNAAGEPVAELTADNADLRWTVHVANAKAAWYQFQIALDIPEADKADDSNLRNPKIPADQRSLLVIDPGSRSVRGRNLSGGPEYRFDTGTFMDKPVYLGELRTDDSGRLIFLGGHGVSASATGAPASTFANNDGWYDDTSDGPVTAEVRIDGRPIPVEPGWVVTAPPNYAPELSSVRTMYDLVRGSFFSAGLLDEPRQVSFTRDVLPVLRRLSGLQWVNKGLATQFGFGGREYLLDPDRLAGLADPSPVHRELRRQVWLSVRNYDRDGMSPVPWPAVYGDAMNLPPQSVRQHMTLSPLQYRVLQRWAGGDFDADHDPQAVPPATLDDVPFADRPATLDRAALSFCLADAFHPGCELTWPMRHTTLYSSPFRIRHRAADAPSPPYYGQTLTSETALSLDGPLHAQGPGDLTRWMAVPWQTDTASCRSGYEYSVSLGLGPYDPYLPTFWPARVPNHVLAEEDYDVVVDTARPIVDRLAAFESRRTWLRWLPRDYIAAINAMVQDFGKLGVVERRPGPPDDPRFPTELLVESEVSFPPEPAPPAGRNLVTVHVDRGADPVLGSSALATAVTMADAPDEEVSAGFIDKVKRFRSGR